jgi:hypothetical protein
MGINEYEVGTLVPDADISFSADSSGAVDMCMKTLSCPSFITPSQTSANLHFYAFLIKALQLPGPDVYI